MQQKLLSRYLVTLTCVMALTTTAQAVEWPVFGPVRMEALFKYDQWKRQTDQTISDDYSLQAGISVEGDAYWIDPGILNFYYYLEPIYINSSFFARARQSNQSRKDDWKGHAINYDLTLDLLRDTTLPVYSTLSTRRSYTINNGSFGQRSQADLKQNSVLLGWKNTYFPLTFRFDVRDNFTVTDPGLDRPSFVRDDLEHILFIQGNSSKTYMELEQRSLDDRVISRNNDFDETRAMLRHDLPWGVDSNLHSRFQYRNRTGFGAVERIQLNELANIRHGENYKSETRYQFHSTTQNITSTTHTGSFRLGRKFYSNLTTYGSLRAEDRRAGDAHLTEREIGLNISYHKPDFFGANVSAHVAGRYSINELDSNGGFFEVFEQPHLVPLTGEVILNDRFILVATILVTDVTSTVEFVAGVDYDIDSIPGNLTRLLVIPGGQIHTGNTILVSYKAAITPSVEYSALNTTTGFNISKGWFSLSHYDTQLNYNTISGTGGAFLAETRNMTSRMDIQWDMGRTTNQFSAERRFYKNGVFETTTYTLTQSLHMELTPRLLMNLSLTGSHSESDAEDIDLYLLNLNFLWRPNPFWTIRPILGAWKRERSDIPDTAAGIRDERILSASLNVRWSFRKINVDFNLRHNDRVADDANFVDDNLTLNVRRRF